MMNKIILIGCPGSGKSTLSIKLAEKLNYPILHLDKIYHIDNKNNIGREELIKETIEFAKSNDKWIIDGNYLGTMDLRIELCDTIILFNIDTKICIKNVMHRIENGNPAIAENFDESIIDENFIKFISDFRELSFPMIYDKAIKSKKKLIIFDNYNEMDDFLSTIN